jgi:hypothetical protein
MKKSQMNCACRYYGVKLKRPQCAAMGQSVNRQKWSFSGQKEKLQDIHALVERSAVGIGHGDRFTADDQCAIAHGIYLFYGGDI